MSQLNAAPIVFANVASSTQQGVVQLASDLGGTSTAPLVAKLNGVTLPAGAPSAGQSLIAVSPTQLAYGTSVKRVTTVSYAASLAPVADTTDIFRVTLTGNSTINNPTATAPVAGQTLQFEFTQDSSGSRTVTFGSAYTFSTDIPAVTFSTGSNKSDIILFQYSAAATVWRCVGIVRGF